MFTNSLSRRHFIGGVSSIAAATALVGCASDKTNPSALSRIEPEKIPLSVHARCGICPEQCGCIAVVEEGNLSKLFGESNHPKSQGKLCARGYALKDILYSEERLTSPMKKNDQGIFEEISWEQAYSEISESLKNLVNQNGAQSIAFLQEKQVTADYYSKRFMQVLGSPNMFTTRTATGASEEAALIQTLGSRAYLSDIAHSKMTMFLGNSLGGNACPAKVAELQEAHDSGARLVGVGSFYHDSDIWMDEWIPINPGTELALVLAFCQILVEEGSYDKEFISTYSDGLDTWKEFLAKYTPMWAKEITGISTSHITELAHSFVSSAPAASIVLGDQGGTYRNSGETARAVALFNSLLGCWNKTGGAFLVPDTTFGDLDSDTFPEPKKISEKRIGADRYPLSSFSEAGTLSLIGKSIKDGSIKGMIFYGSNILANDFNPQQLIGALPDLELCIVIDSQMSEVARQAKFILPECTFLEREELPLLIPGRIPAVSIGNQAVERVHASSKSIDEIIRELAAGCGFEKYFDFSLSDLASAQLNTLGVKYNSLKQIGFTYLSNQEIAYDSTPTFNTASGKIEFSNQAMEEAGLSKIVEWIDPEIPISSNTNRLRLIGSKQPIHLGILTTHTEKLMAITKDYDLNRAWINTSTADELGLKDNDEVEISSDVYSGRCRIKSTERLIPKTLLMPDYYGSEEQDLSHAYGVGLRRMNFVPDLAEPGYGAIMSNESTVSVKKVGA